MLFGMSVVPKIILIGGPQATGKTTLAKELSSRLDIPWISTDQIRTICGITPRGKGLFQVMGEKVVPLGR